MRMIEEWFLLQTELTLFSIKRLKGYLCKKFVMFRILALTLLSILYQYVNTYGQHDVTIRVIHTSDVHGALFPFDYINNKAVDFGQAQVHSYVEQVRNTSGNEVILLDNGDFLQGQPTVYYSNYIDTTSQHIVSKVMNFMRYDAASVGNHDIEAGPRVYNELTEDFTFPWLSANIIDTRTQQPFFQPYTVVTKNNVRVAVLGLTTPGIPKWLSPSLWPNMRFDDMVETAKLWIDSIRIYEDPHVIIGLFHAGHDATYEGANPTLPLNDNASVLVAEKVPGFDLILIGHDHDRTIKKVTNINGNTVTIVDPGSRAHLVSDATISLSFDSENNLQNKSISAKLVAMNEMIPDPNYVSIFSDFTSEVERFVDRKIGSFTHSISTRDAYFGPSAFVNLIHEVQLGISKCDVSFAAPLFFDAEINQGDVYVRDMFKLYGYENLLYIMELSGQEIKNYLEYSYGLWMKTMESANDNMILFRTDENGIPILHNKGRGLLKSSFYNFDSAAGISYEVDLTKPAGDRISIKSMENGEPFKNDKMYRVAINSYRGNGGGGHLTEGAGLSSAELQKRIISVSSKDMRFYLMNWIENSGKISPVKPCNWRVIPEEWANEAAIRDRELLFGKEL
jgi:2',3'-cyclic-nucleotide 2'-phosphodiesterase/3'-nucleotidase